MTDAGRNFGSVAARYAALRPDYPPELFAFLLKRLDGPTSCAVDLGAGSGQASRTLAAVFSRVIAVEADPRMLAELRDDRIEKVNCAAEEADFAAGSIDAVIAATSFHWMDQDAVVASVARWLRQKGVFFPFLYTPFAILGPARAVYERHWALWAPFLDRRLGAKADYARPIRESGAFDIVDMFSGRIARQLSPEDAAGLLCTASYARAYLAACGESEKGYARRLADELGAVATTIDVEFPLGGVLAVKK